MEENRICTCSVKKKINIYQDVRTSVGYDFWQQQRTKKVKAVEHLQNLCTKAVAHGMRRDKDDISTLSSHLQNDVYAALHLEKMRDTFFVLEGSDRCYPDHCNFAGSVYYVDQNNHMTLETTFPAYFENV